MNTSELPSTDSGVQKQENQRRVNSLESFDISASDDMTSPKPDDVFTFDDVEVQQFHRNSVETIQARPLPPLPPPSMDPEEPEDVAPDVEIPEPEYACVDEDGSYEAIHHQRSISDHVLGSYQRREEQVSDALEFVNSNQCVFR